ncbi:tyrosine-type recombinase/integrase [Nocardia transvalensis]|uniref:tyrosine-type recombinase/integrase n=1 Tax=Nocardia transvalensis TaxID=37333 RepID=UPI0018930263|nr:tyrosine-type recombinase/integrase [Nocardia transvalensis]MBF6333247.1 tyrosine-type recombinase/integrase [Nocardia transvalensis]
MAPATPVCISHFYKDVWAPTLGVLSLAEVQPLHGKRPRIHDLRHTCASWMLAAGVPIYVVQAHLGHESIKTTVDTYGHLDRTAAANAAAVIGANLTAMAELAKVVRFPAPAHNATTALLAEAA